jgi:hypothetical protein
MIDIEKLKEQAAIDLSLDEQNIEKKSLQLSTFHMRYLNLYFSSLRELKGISEKKDKLYGEKFHALRKNGYEGYDVKNKGEAEIYLNLDESYTKVCSEFKDVEFVVKFLENVLDQIKTLGFTIKNWIDVSKLKSGN